ncbi:MAG: ATP-binding protein [Spirochaetota bacterium]
MIRMLSTNRVLVISVAVILILLSLAAAVFHSIAETLRYEAFIDTKRKAMAPTVAMIDSYVLSTSLRAVTALAALPESAETARGKRGLSDASTAAAFTFALNEHRASLVFIMNSEGTVTASLPAPGRPNITGNNYRFRKYFLSAVSGTPIIYPAVGVTTMERGFYSAAPIRVRNAVVGVAVIKIDASVIDELLAAHRNIALIVSPNNVVFSANDTNWILHSILPPTNGTTNFGRQFADLPIVPAPLTLRENRFTRTNVAYSVIHHNLPSISEPGWKVLHIVKGDRRHPLNPNERALMVTLMVFFAILYIIIVGLALIVHRSLTMHREVKRQAAELIRINEEVREFASIASHDLREPLRLITNYLELLGRRYQGVLDDKGHEFIAAAVRSGNKMNHLISDLLAYSRAGVAPKRMQTVHCSLIIDEVRANLRIAIEESGATIRASDLPVITADPVQFVQLFQNLIENAIKFQAPGIAPLITITAERQQNAWLFSVADNGIGIPKEHIENIFLVFHRGAGGRAGTGLGLAIAKRVVEAHGGTIRATSDSTGSTFHFTICDGR